VEAYAQGTTGMFDIGRFPNGTDAQAEAIAAALDASTCESVARADIMRWKYRKLINNLSNAVDALCGPNERVGTLSARLRDEAMACLAAAEIECASPEEDAARRGTGMQWGSAASQSRPGASMWQSMARGVSIEADYLNGEIVKLGRLHGIPTPVNAALQRIANQAAREQWAAGSVDPDELIRLVRQSEETS
jgi:2-dehydropantoate 2-reductase